MFYIGCHLSSAKGFLAMAKDAERIGATTFQFFTRNPRGGNAKKPDPEDIAAFLKRKEELGLGPLITHAPYTLNAASDKPEVRDFAFRAMSEDLERLELVPGNYYNFHPGSHVGQGSEEGIRLIAGMLNEILTRSSIRRCFWRPWPEREARSEGGLRSFRKSFPERSIRSAWAFAWIPVTYGTGAMISRNAWRRYSPNLTGSSAFLS